MCYMCGSNDGKIFKEEKSNKIFKILIKNVEHQINIKLLLKI